MTKTLKKKTSNKLVWFLSLPIRVYRYFISPLLGPNCRFYPSCSSYCLKALEQHGILRGGYLGCKRLLKCHPGNAGGYDPVPESSDCNHSGDQRNTGPDIEPLNCKHQHSETIT